MEMLDIGNVETEFFAELWTSALVEADHLGCLAEDCPTYANQLKQYQK